MKVCISCRKKFNSTDWKCPACQAGFAFIDGFPALSSAPVPLDGFKAEYFSRLARLEANNFWFCARNQLILWAIKKYFPDAHNYFEIGCGTGFVLSAVENTFRQFSLYGSDIYPEVLKFAKQRLQKTNLLQMDAREIPFEDEFDIIGAFDVIEHIEDDESVLSQMYSAVHRGGGIILTVPQHLFLWSQFDDSSLHVRRYSLKEFQHKVTKAGFRIVDTISFMSLLFPLMFISRLKKKTHNNKYDIMTDLKINGVINAVFVSVLDCERFLINLGMRLPFGGSLLLIARKDF